MDMMLDFVSTTQGGTVTIDSALSMKEGNKERDSSASTSSLAVEGAKLQIEMDTDQFQTAQDVTVTIHAALFLMIQVKKKRASTVSALSHLAAQGVTLLIDMTTEPVSVAKSVTVRIDAVVCLMIEGKKERASTTEGPQQWRLGV